MDRNETVRISRLAAFGGLTSTDVSVLLIQYCVSDSNPLNNVGQERKLLQIF